MLACKVDTNIELLVFFNSCKRQVEILVFGEKKRKRKKDSVQMKSDLFSSVPQTESPESAKNDLSHKKSLAMTPLGKAPV
jgi:hypothetical protein